VALARALYAASEKLLKIVAHLLDFHETKEEQNKQ